MDIGINDDDLDYLDDFENTPQLQINEEDTHEENQSYDQEESTTSQDESDFLNSFLKSRGIEDRSKIKFEDEYGNIEEVNWDNLSTEDKLNLLESSNEDPDVDLDDEEVQLVNAWRSSNLNPKEYIQAIQRNAVEQYIKSQQTQETYYRVDEFSDDELFVMDLLTRTKDMTQEEAYELLDRAKTNETIFKKQIDALRSEYKYQEDEVNKYNELQQQQIQQQQFEQFARSVENSIINFNKLSEFGIELDQDSAQDVYELLTGTDSAGNNYFRKILDDTDSLVELAVWALKGKEMLNNVINYYNKEITNVRKESFNKGLQAQKDKPTIVYKNKQLDLNKSNYYDDLD